MVDTRQRIPAGGPVDSCERLGPCIDIVADLHTLTEEV